MRTTFLTFAIVPALFLAACTSNTVQDDADTEPSITDESPEGDAGVAARSAREHLAAELGVDADDIAVESTLAQDWSDSCLGLGGPAESCLAAITPGFAMVLEYDGETYNYRTNLDGTSVRVE